MDLSIIMVNYNTSATTRNAVESIINTVKEIEYEIIIVDNSTSGDSFCFADDRVKVFDNIENKGFGNACNIGANKASGKYVLFLNSDTILDKDTVDKAYAYIVQDDSIGALGVRQLLPNGKLDEGCKRGFPTPMNSLYYFMGLSKKYPHSKKYAAYKQTFIDEHSVADVDCISGAFMLMRREVFDFVFGFDEDYFMYGEDVDLCYRLKKNGFRIVYYGKTHFTHLKGESGANSLFVLKHFYKSMKIFYDKHYKQKYCFIVGLMVKLGIDLKYFLARRALIKKGEVKNG